jgi:hypothetical protein
VSLGDPESGFDVTVPSPARIYDYLFHGKDHFIADRTVGDELLKVMPDARQAAFENRAFLMRAVPDEISKVAQEVYAEASASTVPRTRADIEEFFASLELVVPGGRRRARVAPFTTGVAAGGYAVAALMLGGVGKKLER